MNVLSKFSYCKDIVSSIHATVFVFIGYFVLINKCQPILLFVVSASYFLTDCFYQSHDIYGLGIFVPHHLLSIVVEYTIVYLNNDLEFRNALLLGFICAEMSNFPLYWVKYELTNKRRVSSFIILLECVWYLFWRCLGTCYVLSNLFENNRWQIWWYITFIVFVIFVVSMFWGLGMIKSYLRTRSKERTVSLNRQF